MAEEPQGLKNLNHIRLHELDSFFRNEINKFEDDAPLRKHLQGDADEYLNAYNTLYEHPYGQKLILMEDEFNLHFEAFMKPLDRAMNVMVDDLFYDFSDIGMTIDEGLMEIPDFAAARSLMPPRPDNKKKYICHCEGDTYGQVWPVEDIKPLLEWIAREENRKHAEYLGVLKVMDTLLSVNKSIEKHIEKHELAELHTNLRVERWGISLAIPIIIMELYPDIKYHETPRNIDPRDIVHPILETRAEQKLMEEFSFNDFSHDSFLTMGERFVNQRKNINDLNGKIEEDLLEDFEAYKQAVLLLKQSEFWPSFQDAESIWYRESERFLLSIKFSVESFDADDPERWKKHEESERFKSAKALWEMLPHNPFESLWFIHRGDSLSENQWKVMQSSFSEVNEQIMLKDIGADTIFRDCLEADREAKRIASMIVDNGGEAHAQIRKTRKHLTAVLNLLQHIAEKEARKVNK